MRRPNWICYSILLCTVLLSFSPKVVESSSSPKTCDESQQQCKQDQEEEIPLFLSSSDKGMIASIDIDNFDWDKNYGLFSMWIYFLPKHHHYHHPGTTTARTNILYDDASPTILTIFDSDTDDEDNDDDYETSDTPINEPLTLVMNRKTRRLELNLWWWDEDPDSIHLLHSDTHLKEESWIHVSFAWMHNHPKADTMLELYINGKATYQKAFIPRMPPLFHNNKEKKKGHKSQSRSTSNPFIFGGDTPGVEGYISHFGIWSRPKTTTETALSFGEKEASALVDQVYAAGRNMETLEQLEPTHLFSLGLTQDEINVLIEEENYTEEEEKYYDKLMDETDYGTVYYEKHTPSVATHDPYWKYKDGKYHRTITAKTIHDSDDVARSRRSYIRDAMKHLWEGYRKHAWGSDEVKPLTHRPNDCWGGMGTTLVDSLSTLWLLNMTDEFNEGRDWVANELRFDNVGQVSVFETTIRILGGLLSAYDLSGEKIFLDKANDLGQRLLPAFDSPSGVPYGLVTLSGNGAKGLSNPVNINWHRNTAALAELGTLQLEFRYLARSTGNPEYEKKAMKVFELMEPLQPRDGLFPVFIDNLHSAPRLSKGKISMGALGDSFYEYLLKVWLQGGKKEGHYRRMYDRAMDGVHSKMVKESKPNGLVYIAELDANNGVRHDMDHLACFMGGNLALGAYTHPEGLSSPAAQRDLQLGKALAYTCYQMYARTNTGLAAETVRFPTTANSVDFDSRSQHNILRPETVESFFILHYLTKDPVYREWGWEVFESIEKCCRTHIAYASLRNVNDFHKGHDDRMESFFPAETLKYLYLLQDPDLHLDILNTHVFNTEAHPLRILDEM